MYRSFIFLTSIFILTLSATAQVIQRQPVPAHVEQEAQQAVKVLVAEVLKENYLYSLQTMYPRWKDSTAKRVGGQEQLKQLLLRAPKEMKAKGITIVDYQVAKANSSFEVNATLYQNSRQAPSFSEYLVFVPTTALYRVIDPNSGQSKRLRIESYQVAIRGKQNENWSFIDGSSLTVADLRSLFPNLPKDEKRLLLPRRKVEELKFRK